MRIKELEELLGIPRATIRYYEKQGLITPARNGENEYREYSAEDISRLKKILILRKIGFSLSEIEDLLDETADLSSLLAERIDDLKSQKSEIDGAISLCEEMQRSSVTMQSLNEDYYWDEIHAKEEEGFSFFDLLSAETENILYRMAADVEYSPGHGPRTPDLIWNPMRNTTKKIKSFWEGHSLLHIVLVILILIISLVFVIMIGMME